MYVDEFFAVVDTRVCTWVGGGGVQRVAEHIDVYECILKSDQVCWE